MRVEVGFSGASHTCGTLPTVFYFDSDRTSLEAVKAALALSLVSLLSGNSVLPMYDCADGYGYGVALQIAG